VSTHSASNSIAGASGGIGPGGAGITPEVVLQWSVTAFVEQFDRMHRIGVLMSGFAADKKGW
jgi:hypothetical protein